MTAKLSARLEAVKRQAIPNGSPGRSLAAGMGGVAAAEPNPVGGKQYQVLATGVAEFVRRGSEAEAAGDLRAALSTYQQGLKATMPRLDQLPPADKSLLKPQVRRRKWDPIGALLRSPF